MSEKSHVSRLFLGKFTTNFRLQFVKLQIKAFEKLSYFQEKGEHLVFTFSQTSTLNSYKFFNLQPILDCNIAKFKLRHQKFKNGKIKLVSEFFFAIFKQTCVAFLGTPGILLGVVF